MDQDYTYARPTTPPNNSVKDSVLDAGGIRFSSWLYSACVKGNGSQNNHMVKQIPTDLNRDVGVLNTAPYAW
jgi:hypothetical protein